LKFYLVEEDRAAGYTGDLRAIHRWGFPGVTPCEVCGAAGGWAGLQYPCVDLSSLPERSELEDPGRQVSFEEFGRLRERVRPHAPDWPDCRERAHGGGRAEAGAGRRHLP
jgi:uncharacterized double-CXXCG motif protein